MEQEKINIEARLKKTIQEVKYLATENSWRYRPLMRYCFLKYEQLQYWLYKTDIWKELSAYPEFRDYTLEECQQDLDTLCQWGNLIPVQDTAKARTVEEFKTKQYRYQLSEYSVEIERMTIALENLAVEGGSLEPSLIERICEALRRLPKMAQAEYTATGAWWHSLNTDFKVLNQNYQDYMRSFHSLKAEELLKSSAFISYKDSVIAYLREFIKGLQSNAALIEEELRRVDENIIEEMIEKILTYEMSIPRLELLDETEIRERIYGRWLSIKGWFLGTESRDSEVVRLFNITNELIRKITRYAVQILESLNSAANRKEEYKKLAELFLNCSSMEECHKLSSLAFGVFNSRHFKGDLSRPTDSITGSVYDEPPLMVEIRPRIRTYREKASKLPIIDKSKQKEKLYGQYINDLRRE